MQVRLEISNEDIVAMAIIIFFNIYNRITVMK